jgi:hypothetical protein
MVVKIMERGEGDKTASKLDVRTVATAVEISTDPPTCLTLASLFWVQCHFKPTNKPLEPFAKSKNPLSGTCVTCAPG